MSENRNVQINFASELAVIFSPSIITTSDLNVSIIIQVIEEDLVSENNWSQDIICKQICCFFLVYV